MITKQPVTRIVKGYPKREWQKTRDRNEALDCRIYARAAAIALGIDRWTEQKWEQIADIQSENDECISFNVKKSRKKVIKSSWI
ncbi:MAG: phage terminase large subunit family protein [Alphaproteobacteria bacterium]|nr:phage terminase large subunit family protein [Alphaproteobacteria bacterium]